MSDLFTTHNDDSLMWGKTDNFSRVCTTLATTEQLTAIFGPPDEDGEWAVSCDGIVFTIYRHKSNPEYSIGGHIDHQQATLELARSLIESRTPEPLTHYVGDNTRAGFPFGPYSQAQAEKMVAEHPKRRFLIAAGDMDPQYHAQALEKARMDAANA